MRVAFARRVALYAAVGLLLALLAPAVPPAHALGTITVNTLAGKNDSNDGKCSLTEAVAAVSTASNPPAFNECPGKTSPAIITFGVSGTIKLESTMYLGNGINISITGNQPITIDGSSPQLSSFIFRVLPGGTLNLANLTLAKSTYTAISNGGTLNIAGVSFDGNVTGTDGGAIDSSSTGVVHIAGSNFVGNKAGTTFQGGAIRSSGELVVAGSNFNGNSAGDGGGAISISGGKLEIADTIFSGNLATGGSGKGGGAIHISSSAIITSLSITRSVFSGNLSTKGGGGAIFHDTDDLLAIRDSSFQGNLAGTPISDVRPGGAILNWGTLAISGSVFLNNGASGNGGAIANGDAGATDQTPSPARHGLLTLDNVSFTANAAADKGGAIANMYLNDGQTLTGTNVTFSSNAAISSGGGIYNDEPRYDLATFANTIFDGSDGTGGNCGDPDAGTDTIVSNGHNLDSGTSCALSAAGDLSSADPKLDLPSFNGGPLATLLTQKLKPGSAAIDAGDPAICAAAPVSNQDQRGKPRPKDGDGNGTAICDIGAFENDELAAGFGSAPVQPGPIVFGNAKVNTTIGAGFSLLDTGDASLHIGPATISGANASDFTLTTALPITIAPGGTATINLSCTPTAEGPRSATLTLATNDSQHPSVAYTLACNGTVDPVAGFGSTPDAPGPLNIGEVQLGSSASASISAKETGNAQLTVSGATISGANPADFAVTTAFPLTIADGGAAKLLTVKCTPAAPGIRTATLTLATNDPARSSVSFNLSCTGVVPPVPPLESPGQSIGNSLSDGNIGPFAVAVSPDGQYIYMTDSGDNLLTVYKRNSDGTVFFITSYMDNGPDELGTTITNMSGPHYVAVSPDGNNVYVAATASNAVVAFARDQETGRLTYLDSVKEGDSTCIFVSCPAVTGLQGAYGVVVSPDGRHVYATGATDNAVVALYRSSDGGLNHTIVSFGTYANYIQTITRPSGQTDLDSPRGLAISPDGQNIYVAAYSSNKLTTLKRNASDGTLSYVGSIADGALYAINPFRFVDGLSQVFSAAVSPDGNDVYAAGFNDDAIAAFRRDLTANGLLRYAGVYKDGSNGIDGLDGAIGVAVSPDGAHLFAAGDLDNALAVFERDTTSGQLRFAQVVKRNPPTGSNPNPALGGAHDVAVNPDGRAVYIPAYTDNRMVTLRFTNPAPTLNSLAPASATASNNAMTLIVNGADFVAGARVNWNGLDLATTFVNSGKLQATVGVGLLANAGTRTVKVRNPAPGGGDSNALTFTISAASQNPVPSITGVNPPGATAGGADLTLTVSGANFIAASKVRWNGVERPTTFVSPTTLQAAIGGADIAQPGEAGVTVVTPSPGGGTSNAAAFTISAPGQNPAPSITRLTPPSANAGSLGGATLTLTIDGANFIADSQARWNGENRPTTFVSDSRLRVAISAGDLGVPATASVTVVNPAPGGGESNVATFTIGASGDNPVPVLGTYSVAGAGGGNLTITLNGSGFVAGSKLLWNGAQRSASVLGGTQIRVTISIPEFRTAVVDVVNPTPGGGQSNDLLIVPRVVYLPLMRR